MDLKKIKSLYINEIIWMKKFFKKLDFCIYFFVKSAIINTSDEFTAKHHIISKLRDDFIFKYICKRVQ